MKKFIVIIFFINIYTHACLWDHDTLQMERQRFPGILELITGKFIHHSAEFYKWRIEDRIEKLKSNPDNLAYYDDLAVAYDKTGQHQKAIDTILQKEQKKPGLYETYANLGTFYIHSGQYEKGIEYIDQALEINPDAHFGREIYQKYLVQYIIKNQKDGKTKLPLFGNDQHFNFFLKKQLKDNFDNKHALKGILGMMKFGNYESPILLEALAHLLLHGGEGEDAKQLASRAFLKVFYQTEDKETKEAYYRLAQQMIGFHREKKWQEFEKKFTEELEEAENYRKQVKMDEIKWIQENKDVEKEFAQKYYKEPEFAQPSYFYFNLQLTILFGLLLCYHLTIRLPAKQKFQNIQTYIGHKNEENLFKTIFFITALILTLRLISGMIKGFSFSDSFWYY